MWITKIPPFVLRSVVWVFLSMTGLAARLPGGRYFRFLILAEWAKNALARGDSERAAAHSRELLEIAKDYPNDWNYGNAIHHGHLGLGQVALADGNVELARRELLASAMTPGSPQLCSFGPNMALAGALLVAGEREVVLEYFRLCRSFWELGESRLSFWESEVSQGRTPQFGPNLRY